MNTVKASTEKLSQEVKSNGFFLKENWLTKLVSRKTGAWKDVDVIVIVIKHY